MSLQTTLSAPSGTGDQHMSAKRRRRRHHRAEIARSCSSDHGHDNLTSAEIILSLPNTIDQLRQRDGIMGALVTRPRHCLRDHTQRLDSLCPLPKW